MTITALTVSAQSNDAGKLISDLHPQLKGMVDLPLQPMSDISEFTDGVDVVFLATAHEVSHDLAPQFLAAGCVVFDLSGAFRVNDGAFYEKYYGFTHQHPDLLETAVYGLAEWSADKLKEADLIAVPGCYPTAAQLSLKPLIDAGLLDLSQWPVINATSGVSGAGRKAAISNSFCEVSLQPYGVFNHRHHPEITTHLGAEVIFTPHLGSFPRGILETITCRLKPGVTKEQVNEALTQAYADKPLVRLYDKGVPALKNVVGLPFCDIGFAVQGEHLIVVAAEDNLLKGAAAQAMHEEALERLFTALVNYRESHQRPLVIVHGGGCVVDELMKGLNLPVKKKNGLRVTPADQIDIITGALAGTANKTLLAWAKKHHILSVGLYLGDGDSVKVTQLDEELGHVGLAQPGSPKLINTLLEGGFLPVVSSIGVTEEGDLMNVNADQAATALAATLGADLILLSDVSGILDGKGQRIAEMTAEKAEQLIAQGIITDGMIVKVNAALDAARTLGRPVDIASWRHAEQLPALFNGTPIGTRILA
ncbi:hypothetical protein L1887_45330 [Cichorium endivia]|nr:hypothetical protein L1887_45330 [Cichorium endivia]